MAGRVGGICYLKIDGVQYDVKGSFTYNLGVNKRESIVGHDGVHGFKELPQVAFIEGEITDRRDLNLAKLLNASDATVTLELANGKTIVLSNAWCVAEGTGNTEEGNITIRFEGTKAEEI